MRNRLYCLLSLPLILVSIIAAAQTTDNSSSSGGQGSSNCSASDPTCQTSGQSGSGRTNYPSYGNNTGAMPSMQQGDAIYVDSAGQIRQNNPQNYPNQGYNNQGYQNQNYPYQGYQNQNYPYQGYPYNQGYNLNYEMQQPDPITDFQRLVASSTGQLVPIYGRQLFRGVPTTFAPIDETPVTPDYVVGPGDELLIRVWGPVVFNDRLTVDRSGSIYVPKVGSIHVSGIPFSGLDKHLRSEIGRVFRNFDLNVNMGQLRSIQVFVLGQARRPGSYTVSSLSTLLNALFASGGPSVHGSMRSIQLKREGKTISDFDLYDLLSKGDKSQDVRLLPGDVIFIPPTGPQVAVTGSIRITGIYELKDESKGPTTLEEVLRFAGGLSSTASAVHASVERIEDHRVRQVAQIDMDAAGKATVLHDGDVLRVFSITGKYDKTVTLRGNLANPGRFAWHPGMRLSELIPEQEALLTNHYWRNHNMLGLPGPVLFEPPLNNGSNGSNSSLNANSTQTGARASSPSGTPNDATAAQASDAQGATTDATKSAAASGVPGGQPGAAMGATEEASQGSLASQQSRYVPGASGAAADRVDIRIPAAEIDWAYAVIERLDPVTLQNTLLPFNLGSLVLKHDQSQDLALQAGDVVTILSQADIRVPIAQQTKFVKLGGEIVSSGTYSVHPGETLRQIIQRAGGLTPNAYLFGSEFTRQSARILQQQRLDEYVNSLAIDLQRQGTNRISSAISPQDASATAAVVAGQKELLDRLRLVKATGRIVIEIKPDANTVATIPDIGLEDGDSFIVPSVPGNVNVVGAVYNQNAFLYDPSRRVANYLLLAGGPNRNSDKKHAFLIRADGSVFSKETAKTLWGNTFVHSAVNPGDTIVVPEKLFGGSAMRNLIEWSQVISQLGIGAATLYILTK